MTEDWDLYRRLFAKSGDSASFEEIYTRERALFGMFSAGVSCIESTIYALAALLSHPSVLNFRFNEEDQRKCNPRKLVERLEKFERAKDLRSALATYGTSGEWKMWIDLRNRMNHRSNIPRIIRANVGTPEPTQQVIGFGATTSTPRIEQNVAYFDKLRDGLASNLKALLALGGKVANEP